VNDVHRNDRCCHCRAAMGWGPRVALLVAVTGCSPVWSRVTTPGPLTPSGNQRVQVWSRRDGVHYWYRVAIGRDSISGVPYKAGSDLGGPAAPRPVPGDTSRLGLPLADVDSIRLGSANPANFALAAVAVIVLAWNFGIR